MIQQPTTNERTTAGTYTNNCSTDGVATVAVSCVDFDASKADDVD